MASKETEEQIKFEENDLFKKNVVYPLLTQEIESICTSGKITTLHLGVGSGLEVCQLPADAIRCSILIDKNEEILNIANVRFLNRGVSTTMVIHSDSIDQISVTPETVDIACCLFSLNQIQDIEETYKTIYEKLVKGGKMLVVVPHEAFILFCSTYRPERLSSPVDNIFNRNIIKFIFSGVNLQSELYVRPNSDYMNGMIRSGFAITKVMDLYDKYDDTIGDVPKGFLLVGQK